jgi:hypothetical protein
MAGGKYDTESGVSWFVSRFLVMVSWVPGRAETMTKGDMARVMVCRSYTRARTGASMGSLKGTNRVDGCHGFRPLPAKGERALSPTAAPYTLCS